MEGKNTKSSHKKAKKIRTTKPLDLFHMDLMGLKCTESTRSGKRYVLVVVDDFLRYSFMSFLREIRDHRALEVFIQKNTGGDRSSNCKN